MLGLCLNTRVHTAVFNRTSPSKALMVGVFAWRTLGATGVNHLSGRHFLSSLNARLFKQLSLKNYNFQY